MSFDWQNLAALLVVATAGAYLIRVAWQSVSVRKAGGCGSCGTCPSDSPAGAKEVFTIEPAPQKVHAVSNGKLGSDDGLGH